MDIKLLCRYNNFWFNHKLQRSFKGKHWESVQRGVHKKATPFRVL